jgi:hypothetical protein
MDMSGCFHNITNRREARGILLQLPTLTRIIQNLYAGVSQKLGDEKY